MYITLMLLHSHAHLHGIGQHSGESEGNLLRELLPDHGYLKTVTKVNVKHTPSQTIQHQV